jgi:hypothetical protein
LSRKRCDERAEVRRADERSESGGQPIVIGWAFSSWLCHVRPTVTILVTYYGCLKLSDSSTRCWLSHMDSAEEDIGVLLSNLK